MMKPHYNELPDQTGMTLRVKDQKDSQNYRLYDSRKMTNLEQDAQQEDSQEDSQEAEDSQEVEDSPEEEDTRVEGEYHLEDHQEEGGDHHRSTCHKPTKENW